jgi:site-specific DNA recombinase
MGRESEAMLVGLLYDGHGRRMTPSQSNKGTKRYRYYVTMPAELDPANAEPPAWRVPAHDLERIIIQRLLAFLGNTNALIDAIGASDPADIEQLAAEARRLASLLETPSDRAPIARSLLDQVALSETSVTLTVQPCVIDTSSNAVSITLQAPVARVRMYKESRLIVLSPASRAAASPDRDERLVQLIAEAFAARELLLASPGATIKDIAERQNICRKRYAQLIRISWLAPDIIKATLDGRHAPSLTAARLIKSDLPANWAAQHDALHPQT